MSSMLSLTSLLPFASYAKFSDSIAPFNFLFTLDAERWDLVLCSIGCLVRLTDCVAVANQIYYPFASILGTRTSSNLSEQTHGYFL